jgi:hypothetical protein
MTDPFEPFPCPECGGTVRMVPPAGETWEFRRGLPVRIPGSVRIPRCDRCGESYLGPADEARVQAAVRAVFLEEQKRHYARCVGQLQRVHGATLGEIERACGVTPTYFSHVMKGRRVASLTLTRLVEAFVAAPGEMARHLAALRGREPESPAATALRGAVAVAPIVATTRGGRTKPSLAQRWSRSSLPPPLRGSA